MSETRIRAYAEHWGDTIAVGIFQDRRLVRSIVWEEYQEGAFYSPSFHLSIQQAQSLMDDLWGAGLRPSAGKQPEGVTAAQAGHLADMRAIAFAKLNIKSPGE